MARDVLAPGEVFAGYTIVRVLGSGGMGAVYVAQHPSLPRLVALKILHRDYTADPYVRSRFEQEAEHAARLDHPNIVTVFDRGRVDDQLWIAMKYIEGMDASVALRSGAFPLERALNVLIATGSALDYAHSQRILHRDVKPANILLTPGQPERVTLTDFGIAKAIDESTQLTQTGMLVATILYASPEQLEGIPLDPRADVYSLTCTFYHLLTGMPPYPGQTAASIIHGHMNLPIPSISAARPGLPPQLDAVIARGLAKDREQRFPSCRALADAVQSVMFRSAHTAPAVNPPPRSFLPPTHHGSTPPNANSSRGVIAVLAVLALVASLVISGYLLWNATKGDSGQEEVAFTGLSGPAGLAFDGSDPVVVDGNNRRVLKLSGDTQSELPFPGLEAPAGVAIHDGAAYVTDPLARKVWQLWSGDSVPKELPLTVESPVGVAVSVEGNIFVSDYVGRSVWILYAQSEDFGLVPVSGLSSPHGMAIHGTTLYIADTNGNRVVAVDLRTYAQRDLPFTGLVSPRHVAVSALGDVYISDASADNRIVKLDSAGKQTTISLDEETRVQGLAIDPTGAIYLADAARNRVIRLSER